MSGKSSMLPVESCDWSSPIIIAPVGGSWSLGAKMETTFVQTGQYEEAARSMLDAAAWCYLECGSGNEQTLRATVAAFEHIWLRPRVLITIPAPHLNTTVLVI